ncbi:ABC transporter substrate-binding protein [Pseudooceanicola sp. 200-1SW]|uniref:ABC transporter substrate-binding protein n=1 Tax=Pseudooceanicola sp. 200-1SW TaxID=3425949 RepID=UPI003D7F4FD0
MKSFLTTTALALTLVAGAAQAQDLRVALSTFEARLDPQDTTGNSGAPFLYQIFDTLIERDSFSNPLTFKPGLATAWTQIDPTTWELTLREGVTFHNGDTFDAHDVEFSLDRMFHHEDPEFFSAWGRWAYNFADVEVVDDMTVRITTHRPEPLFETLMSARSFGIVSKEYYEEKGFDDAALAPVGTGPYQVTDFTPDEKLRMTRFDGYWGPPAALDSVEMYHVPEVASRVTGMVNGEFDLATNIPPDQAPSLDVEGVKTMGVTWPMFHVYVLAMNTAPTDNPLVRRAMRLCTDRQALVDGLWEGKAGTPTAHQFPEYGAPLYMDDLETIKYDPEAAKALLAEAGYDGAPIIAQFPNSYYLYGDLAAQVIQSQWAECGLNLQIEEVDSLDYERLNMRGWSNPMYYPDPMGAMDTHWSEKSWTVSRNLWTPQSPEWAPTYETARFATDPQERRAAYKKLLELSEEESGWLLLYKPHELYAMREDISFEVPIAQRPYVLPLRGGEIDLGD